MDFSALLTDVIVPYLQAIVFVSCVTWAAGKYLPGVRVAKGEKVRSETAKTVLTLLALAAAMLAAFVGMIREDASAAQKAGDGFIVWALATANHVLVKRALGLSKKRGAA